MIARSPSRRFKTSVWWEAFVLGPCFYQGFADVGADVILWPWTPGWLGAKNIVWNFTKIFNKKYTYYHSSRVILEKLIFTNFFQILWDPCLLLLFILFVCIKPDKLWSEAYLLPDLYQDQVDPILGPEPSEGFFENL